MKIINFKLDVTLILCIIHALLDLGQGLRCFSCNDVAYKVNGQYRALKCLSNTEDIGVEECTDGQHVCYTYEADGSADTGSARVEYKVVTRGCMYNAEQAGADVGKCASRSLTAKDIHTTTIFSNNNLKDVQLDGTVCVCDSDLCYYCSSGFIVGGFCLHYWGVAVIVISLMAFITLCTCCSYCCYKCHKDHQREIALVSYGHASDNIRIQSGDISTADQMKFNSDKERLGV